MRRYFSHGQLCASALFVFISRPFPKLFIYLGFTLFLTKLLYQPEPTVRKGEREEKYIFLSVLFAFPPDSFLQCSRRAVSFNLYLKLIKSLIIIFFSFQLELRFQNHQLARTLLDLNVKMQQLKKQQDLERASKSQSQEDDAMNPECGNA